MKSPAETYLACRFATDLEMLVELAKTEPAAAETIRCALVAHLRSAYPVSPLGTLPPPGEPIRDPRG